MVLDFFLPIMVASFPIVIPDQLCKSVPTAAHGYVKNAGPYTIGSSIAFECDPGFTLMGNSILNCEESGEWNPRDAPGCEIVTCPNEILVENGYVVTGNVSPETYTYGSVVEIRCHDGYTLIGPPTVTCGVDGDWSLTPVCSYVCGPYPLSACVTEIYTFFSYLHGTCQNRKDDNMTNHFIVECDIYSDELIPVQLHLDIIECNCDCKVNASDDAVEMRNLESDGYLNHSLTLDWSCLGDTVKETDEPLTCVDGKMGTPSCVPFSLLERVTDTPGNLIDCGNPGVIPNGNMTSTNGTHFPSVITYSCDKGFSLLGHKTRTCQANGEWSGCNPRCQSNKAVLDLISSSFKIAFPGSNG